MTDLCVLCNCILHCSLQLFVLRKRSQSAFTCVLRNTSAVEACFSAAATLLVVLLSNGVKKKKLLCELSYLSEAAGSRTEICRPQSEPQVSHMKGQINMLNGTRALEP